MEEDDDDDDYDDNDNEDEEIARLDKSSVWLGTLL